MAHSRHAQHLPNRPLSGVKQTSTVIYRELR